MILVSACLAGVACRYNGEAAPMEGASVLVEQGLAAAACPEVLGGLPVPRQPSEIRETGRGRRVAAKDGTDVTGAFVAGAEKTLALCREKGVRHAVLKERSPSCGCGSIYDGSFSGALVPGDGITTALLKKQGIRIHPSDGACLEKIRVYDFLDSQGIPYERFSHEPCYTVAEAKALDLAIPGQHVRNLFLRNAKGSRHYLVILQQDRPFDAKQFAADMGYTRLSFASPERLRRHLGVEPGSVGAFGLLNDTEGHVGVIVDRTLDEEGFITFHPNRNDETLRIRFSDFSRMLAFLGRSMHRW